MYGYVYLTTNTINNKRYIGQHKSEIFDEKYKGSGKILVQAFEKYGKENFEWEIIDTCESIDEALFLESMYISQYNSCTFMNNSNGYNILYTQDGKKSMVTLFVTSDGTKVESSDIPIDEIEYDEDAYDMVIDTEEVITPIVSPSNAYSGTR